MKTQNSKRVLDITVQIPMEDIDAFHSMYREFCFGETPHHADIRAKQTDREQGLISLRHLFRVAHDHSGQCRYVARFLLGLYNGTRFPFDLTDFRCIDRELFEHCMVVLRMDRQPQQEVHTYFDGGGHKMEGLALRWRVTDIYDLRQVARSLLDKVGCEGTHAAPATALEMILQANR